MGQCLPKGNSRHCLVFHAHAHPNASAQDLDLLAAAVAASSSNNSSTARETMASLSCFTLFNPFSSLMAKLVKRILELEFVEMSDITTDVELPKTPGHPATSAQLPVMGISVWVEKLCSSRRRQWRFLLIRPP